VSLTPSCSRCGAPLTDPDLSGPCPACLLALGLETDVTKPGVGHPLDPIHDYLPDLPKHYQLESRVGTGGMGIVYRALDTRLNRPVAVKVIQERRLGDPAAGTRFRAEALAAASLDHPFICKVYELIESEANALLVMEFVEGETLAGMLRQGRPPLARTVELVAEIAEGLANAHSVGLVHRDIKPSNVMVTRYGHVKLLDFGLARPEVVSDASATTKSTGLGGDARAGTPHYMSPEQAEGKQISQRADLFSLGVLAFECITGELPFEGATEYAYVHAMLDGSPKPIADLASGTPKELVRLVERCLSKDPARRPESAAAVAQELRKIAETSVAPTAHTIRARSLQKSRNRWARIAVGSLLATGAITAVIVFSRRTPVDNIEVRLSSLVTWPSEEGQSRISPDGRWVSFVSNLDGKLRLFVQPVEAGEAQAVFLPPGRIVNDVWSPDSRQLACAMLSAEGVSIHVLPASSPLTSTAVKAIEIPDVLNLRLVRWVGNDVYFQTDTRSNGEVTTSVLRRADLGSGRISEVSANWRISPSDLPSGFLREFDVSADGKRVVFTLRANQQTDLWTTKVDGTDLIRLTNDSYSERRPIWVGNEETIIYQSNRNAQFDLWEISIRDRKPWQRTTGPIQELPGDASGDGSLVAFDHVSEDGDLWLARPQGLLQLNAGALNDFAPTVSNDGRTLVFQRSRPDTLADVGLMNTLLMRAAFDGQRLQVEPTPLDDGFAARVSPDGTQVAFMQRSGAQSQSFATLKVRELIRGDTQLLSDLSPLPTFSLSPNVWTSPTTSWTSDSRDLLFVERLDAEPGGSMIRRFRRGFGVESTPLVTRANGHRIRDLYRSSDDRLLAYLTGPPGQPGELHVHDLVTNADRVVTTLATLESVKGWTRDQHLLLLRAFGPRPTKVEVVELDVSGRREIVATLDNAYPQTARFDPRQSRLYVTRLEDLAQNLYAVSLSDARVTKVVDNRFPNVSFAGVEALPDGSALYARDESTHDIWLLRRARSGGR
jgi:serine/threonine protein kinase